MSIFQVTNNLELKDYMIDFHGFHLQEALKILRDRMIQIQTDLNTGKLRPNHDAKNHILKIVCGKGIHSHGRPVLKYKIPAYLKEKGYEVFTFEEQGVSLVRMIKR